MTPLDTLKAGMKTAIVTFLVGVLAVVVGVLGALARWAQDGPAPDLGYVRGVVIALVLALASGALNTVARYVQVAGVPFVAALVNRILGAVPAYPEAGVAKAIDSTTGTPTTGVVGSPSVHRDAAGIIDSSTGGN